MHTIRTARKLYYFIIRGKNESKAIEGDVFMTFSSETVLGDNVLMPT